MHLALPKFSGAPDRVVGRVGGTVQRRGSDTLRCSSSSNQSCPGLVYCPARAAPHPRSKPTCSANDTYATVIWND